MSSNRPTDPLLDGDDLGEGRVFSNRGGFRVAVYRCACGREQMAAHPDFPRGVGPKSAEGVGWVRSVDRWFCPYCSGNEDKLRAVFNKEMPNG